MGKKIEFLDAIDMGSDDECWEWLRARSRSGYGASRHRGKFINAHRLAWILYHQREIPNGVVVRHICNNRGCVNPLHLALGTVQDNINDRTRSGNSNGPRKDPNMCAKGIHRWTPENLYVRPSGVRECRHCRKATYDNYYGRT